MTCQTKTGIDLWLPAGDYLASDGQRSQTVTLVSGGSYRVEQLLAGVSLEAKQQGAHVRLFLRGQGEATLRADNLDFAEQRFQLTPDGVCVEAKISNINAPWSAALLPENDPSRTCNVQG